MSETMNCEEVLDALPELALGVLPGAERKAAIDHLQECRRCEAESRLFLTTADHLFELLPAADPPPAFEARVLARRPAHPPVRRIGQPVRLLAAAAVVVVLLGVGSVIGAVASHSSPPVVRQAALESPYGRMGEVVLASGGQPALLVSMREREWSGWVRCVVSFSGGRAETVGRFDVGGGSDVWSVALPRRDVASVRLVAGGGTTLARARF